jgi:hypothetical protein
MRSIGALTARVDESGLDRIAAHPTVTGIEAADRGTLTADCQGDEYVESPPEDPWWQGNVSHVASVHNDTLDGEGQVVAFIGTGVSLQATHLNESWLGHQASGTQTWIDVVDDTSRPEDLCGHGTGAASLAVDGNVGSAPGARWMGVRVADDNGLDDGRGAALQYVRDLGWAQARPASADVGLGPSD